MDATFIAYCSERNITDANQLFHNNTTVFTNADQTITKAFIYSCEYGHLEVAQWLVSLRDTHNIRVDVYANNNWAFHNSCENGYLEVAQWLELICSNYSVIVTYCEEDPAQIINIQPIVSNTLPTQYTDTIVFQPHECPICYEKNVNIKLSCQHNYCLECIQKMYNMCTIIYCPLCREIVTTYTMQCK